MVRSASEHCQAVKANGGESKTLEITAFRARGIRSTAVPLTVPLLEPNLLMNRTAEGQVSPQFV
jgi:hypothetical protein